MTRKEQAVAYYQEGYNCAQAVLCAYCDIWDMDKDIAYRISEGYGGGMGQMGEVCGAVSATFSAVGLENSSGCKEPGATKKTTYGQVKQLAEKFKNSQGTIYCRELLQDKTRTKQEICQGCIAQACDILDNYLSDKE